MMRFTLGSLRRTILMTTFLISSPMAMAQTTFDAPAAPSGEVEFSGKNRSPIVAGGEVEVSGSGFQPEQEVFLHRGQTLIGKEGLTADAEGEFSFTFSLPEDAALGLHPIVVQTQNPDTAAIADLKVSPDLPLSGEDGFDVTSAKLVPGLYQLAYSDASNALFVASSSGRPPEGTSRILRVNPETLEIEAEVTPPTNAEGAVIGAFGIDVDDTNGNIWVTNTRNNSVAVYRQDDLSLVKQFEAGSVENPRDILVDEANNRAYVSTHTRGEVEVLDTQAMEVLEPLTVESSLRGGEFGVMGIALDEEGGKLYAASLLSPEVARFDLKTGEATVFEVAGAVRPTGIEVDPETGRIFVASQNSDDLVAIDGETGEVVFDTPVGSGALSVVLDEATGQLFIASRVSDTITVLDPETGKITANLDGGSFPNHVIAVGDGTIYAVNKARGQDDERGDHIRRIVPQQ